MEEKVGIGVFKSIEKNIRKDFSIITDKVFLNNIEEDNSLFNILDKNIFDNIPKKRLELMLSFADMGIGQTFINRTL